MPANTFSVGRDCQIVLMGPFGRIDLTHVTSFESRQLTHPVRVERMDGVQLGAELPRGWEGHFDVERGSSAVDDFIARMEQIFFATGQMAAGSLYQYVTEADGSTSTYQYDSVVFRLESAGAWRGDGAVKQRLNFFAAKRKRI